MKKKNSKNIPIGIRAEKALKKLLPMQLQIINVPAIP
jgi:hypothetical protein